jgi:dUTP pyrophosphatase
MRTTAQKKKNNMNIQIKKLSDQAKIPTQGSKYAAGYDLYAAEEVLVNTMGRKLVKTNISISIPEGYYGRIAPRSGLAYKNGIDVLAGVIDSDYRGDIGVILFNSDHNLDFQVNVGDRIAQIIIEKCHSVNWDTVENLEASVRSEKGFGSSGV